MAMVCSVYGSEHRQLKRRILALSFLDLIFITTTVVFVIMQLISVGHLYGNLNNPNATEAITNASSILHNFQPEGEVALSLTVPNPGEVLPENSTSKDTNAEFANASEPDCNASDSTGCENSDIDDLTSRTVVGARISLSIQLIIYLAQWGFAVLLLIASYHNDSRNLHLWVLFSEVMVVIVCLNLFINFFGKFLWLSVILTALYILFKIVLIRMVRQFIHVNDLALTQFGSVSEFD